MQAQLRLESQRVSQCKKAVRAKWKAEAQSVAHTEELRKMEAKLTSTSQLANELKSQISQLKIENTFAHAKQKDYNDKLNQENELAAAVNIANIEVKRM
jgi:hypothetical protein